MARTDFRAAAARRLSEERELSPAIVSLLSNDRQGRSRGGVGFPPTTGGGTRQNSGPEYKVTIRNNTVLKDGDNKIALGDFRVGDRILVTGVHNGSATDLDATEIVKNPARDR